MIIGSHVTVGALRGCSMFGVFGKMSGIECRCFPCSPHLHCTPPAPYFLHLAKVLFPSHTFLEMPAIYACYAGCLLS